MIKKQIKLKFQNGLSFEQDVANILAVVQDQYEFVDSDEPDFIVFGPYGKDIPPPGNYVRVGYFCENFTPDMGICDWAFGVPREEEIKHPNYKRIQWHGIRPESLIKNLDENDIDSLCSRNKFCNFLYSNKVPYREEFFRQLSKYKRIDAPGKSMTNMPALGKSTRQSRWEQKLDFLAGYKFTIAFENYCYPGYQTEKLYDAMQVGSIPLYCGDPHISELFNTKSFLNFEASSKLLSSPLLARLGEMSQPSFKEMLPQFYKTPGFRISRKLKAWGRQFKMKRMISKVEINDYIERIVETDKNPSLYADLLRSPWFHQNQIPEHVSSRARWQQIFG